MTTPKDTSARDRLAQEHYDKRAKLFEVNDFDREIIAVESFKLGWDAALDSPEIRALEDAIRKSIAIADDYADSGISRPIRDALKAFCAYRKISQNSS